MSRILIVVDADAASPTTELMVSAIRQAIAAHPPLLPETHPTVEVVSIDTLSTTNTEESGDKYLTLTLNVPDALNLPGASVYRACRDVVGLRQVVEQMGYPTGAGCFWLPLVLTAKGPIYGEVIGLAEECTGKEISEELSLLNLKYQQPVHLADAKRQPLYHLGYRLLQYLSAPPATYLLQFGFKDEKIVFDRLWPYPAAPAIASINIQEPDLFICHWHCLTAKPIFDLTITQPLS
jgi:hypothetical protein